VLRAVSDAQAAPARYCEPHARTVHHLCIGTKSALHCAQASSAWHGAHPNDAAFFGWLRASAATLSVRCSAGTPTPEREAATWLCWRRQRRRRRRWQRCGGGSVAMGAAVAKNDSSFRGGAPSAAPAAAAPAVAAPAFQQRFGDGRLARS